MPIFFGMANLQKWLDDAGFDWATGEVFVQFGEDGKHLTGWDDKVSETRKVERGDPVLALTFDAGFGGPECPRFVARDGEAIYFPWQYDGATGLEKVRLDFDVYKKGEPAPYPGN